MQTEIITRIENNVGWIILNRPQKRNALNHELLQQFLEALISYEADDAVKAVCISAAGDKAFCAGADLKELQQSANVKMVQDLYAAILIKLNDYLKTTLCYVNGACLGGGMGIMLSCDLVFAVEQSTYGTPEVAVGLYPLMISLLLYRHLPKKIADEMILLGRRLEATDALRLGMINRVCTKNEGQSILMDTLALVTKYHSKSFIQARRASKKAMTLDFVASINYLAKTFGELVENNNGQ